MIQQNSRLKKKVKMENQGFLNIQIFYHFDAILKSREMDSISWRICGLKVPDDKSLYKKWYNKNFLPPQKKQNGGYYHLQKDFQKSLAKKKSKRLNSKFHFFPCFQIPQKVDLLISIILGFKMADGTNFQKIDFKNPLSQKIHVSHFFPHRLTLIIPILQLLANNTALIDNFSNVWTDEWNLSVGNGISVYTLHGNSWYIQLIREYSI